MVEYSIGLYDTELSPSLGNLDFEVCCKFWTFIQIVGSFVSEVIFTCEEILFLWWFSLCDCLHF